MDQVDKDRTGPGLPPPRSLEIVLWLVEPGGGLHADDPPQAALGDQVPGLGDDRVVAAVVADQDRHARRLARGDDPARVVERAGKRFFDQHREPGVDAGQRAFCVKLVGGRQDHPVDPAGSQRAFEIDEVRGCGLGGGDAAGVGGIDDAGEFGPPRGQDRIDVAFADQSGAGHGDPRGPGHCDT